jgi:hypothetical protein
MEERGDAAQIQSYRRKWEKEVIMHAHYMLSFFSLVSLPSHFLCSKDSKYQNQEARNHRGIGSYGIN